MEQYQAVVPELPQEDKLGEFAEMAAHGLSITRGLGGLVLYEYIKNNPDYQSWQLAGAFVVLAATDAEGHLARWGRRRQHKDESQRRPFNAYIDQLTDKVLVNAVTKAIAERELANGNVLYANAVEAATEINVTRDVVATADRVVADFQDIDSRAQKAGKLKALKQYGLITIALSPLAKSPAAKAALSLGFAHTTVESVKSYWSMHKSFREQRKERRAARRFSNRTT